MSTMKTIKHLISASIAAGTLLAGTPAAQAIVPQTITHQGRLFDSKKMPVSGPIDVTFKIYVNDEITDPLADPIWTETQTITFDEGYFSTTLGAVTTFESATIPVFDGSVRYMGVTVGTDPEMTPRAAVQSVPYAMVAGDVFGDIHPMSISVGGVPIINNMGEWVGASTGLIGPQGPPGANGVDGMNGTNGTNGMNGMNGVDGAMGPQGPTGVVSTTTIAGLIGTLAAGGGGNAPWVFAGPQATVTVQPGQRITGSAVGVLGHSNGTPQPLSFTLCISDVPALSPLTAFFATTYPDATVGSSGNRTTLSAAASIVPANVPTAGGTYRVGFCVKNKSTNGTNFNANDFVNGWFIVTN